MSARKNPLALAFGSSRRIPKFPHFRHDRIGSPFPSRNFGSLHTCTLTHMDSSPTHHPISLPNNPSTHISSEPTPPSKTPHPAVKAACVGVDVGKRLFPILPVRLGGAAADWSRRSETLSEKVNEGLMPDGMPERETCSLPPPAPSAP
ncbi:hypothetical protein BS50DRAFT_330980 [Corynespora cassiicola Philippines]|uniref:Uncharacterized protein n=1 Tax=Corynespora cassiicola Philippines TaxID=1448308 RepID=A0A2T2NUB3_CORCC|nr:hypothetical protein BS50DRAFT_330980 [Corynespora cassiicola Philippines]